MQDVHPYKLLAARDIDACLALAETALHEWEAGWHADSPLQLDCVDAAQAGELPGVWQAHGATPETAIWVRRQEGFDRQLERLLFDLEQAERSGERRESSIAGNVAVEASRALEAAMLAQLTRGAAAAAHGELPPWLLRRHTGSAVIRIACFGKALDFLVPQTQLPPRKKAQAQQGGARPALTPLPDALTACQARLTAQLGEVDMSLGNLVSLAIGDVIKLPVGIDQPLDILTGNGRRIGQAHLGKQDGCRAMEIFAVPHKQ